MLGTQTHESTHTGALVKRRVRTMRELLNLTCLQHPDAGNEEIVDEWMAACEEEGTEPVRAVWLYALSRLRPVRSTKTAEQRAAEKAASDARIQEAADRSQKEWLKDMLRLDFIMPNGRPLRYNSGTDIGMVGGVWIMVASRVGDNLVGEVLSDDDLQAMIADFAA